MTSTGLFILDSEYHTKLTDGILIISSQGFKLDIDVMLMRCHFQDYVHTCWAPFGISRDSYNPLITKGNGGQQQE